MEVSEECGCVGDVDVSAVDFVVMVLAADEVTVVLVVETCAVATSEVGEPASYAVLDLT